ncbi:MAG TPA: RpiB/LacA/LacB family sugar-phosphate isomerase [Smithellaceae bacterium]|nr:RpiB/LacA/LacB family sugar-phosphate isomerase [Smithellaceae bacterium]
MKKIVIASDHGAVDLKNEVSAFLKTKNCTVNDLGVNSADAVDYPDIAARAAEEFKKGGYDFGILFCGTGIGIAMAANKITGIRCAQVYDLFTAEMARAHNNANFIALGGRVKYCTPVTDMIDKFMNTVFEKGRHERRVAKIMALEE